MLGPALLLAAATVPVVIPDPRGGASPWVEARTGSEPQAGAAGYLLELPVPPGVPSQAWLETAVALGATRAPVIAVGAAPPPADLLPYLDGVCVEPAPAPAAFPELLGRLAGARLVVRERDAAGAVAALAAGADAVVVPDPPAGLAAELAGLLPAPVAARAGTSALPTALRGADLATVIGLPRGFPGGHVALPEGAAGAATLVPPGAAIRLRRVGAETVADLPALPGGGLLVARRPRTGAGGAFESVAVSGERLPTAAEVLARHQRAAARQDRLLPRWRARQRLLVRVWVAELARSFEVVLEGPVFFEHGVGGDWELERAWVDGVAWDPDKLPDLPLLEPRRPPVPPLALRLDPGYAYALRGVEERLGRRCFVLEFTSGPGGDGAVRRGTAWIDAADFGLVELEQTAERLPGEVRATSERTAFRAVTLGGETFRLPERLDADDLVDAFGGTTTVHRELRLAAFAPLPADFAAGRAAAWAGPHRMLRDTPSGVVPLVPDGRGGRVPSTETRAAQRFLLAGVVWDPGLSTPLPLGGLQLQDFDFRGRREQLRLLVAGVVNDAAWSAPRGRVEPSLRAFVQLIPLTSPLFVRGREAKAEELKVQRQRIGGGFAVTAGVTRFLLDLGVDRWDFGRTDNTSPGFVLPSSTFEGVARVEAQASLGAATASLAGEGGWRHDWRAWGTGASEPPRRSWRRVRAAAVWEKAPFPLAKLHLDGELWTGSDLDRFSAPTPARFGGVRIRGIATSLVIPDRLAVARASLALPLSPTLRGEVGIDAAWVRDERSGYRARPLSGVGAAVTAPGPWGTLLQAAVGFPLATPGRRAPTLDLFLLRPLASRHAAE